MDDPRWFADYPRSPPPHGKKKYNYLISRKKLIIPKDLWDMWDAFDERLKNEELDVHPTCRLLLDELKSNEAYNKLRADTCVRLMHLLVTAHDWCVSGKCSSSNAKELLLEYIYASKFGPFGKRRGEEHFELLNKMVPDFIRRCLDLPKSGESRPDDLDLKRKRFLIEDEKSSALSPAPILGNQNMETELASSPVILSKKQVLSLSKAVEEGIEDFENLAPD